MEQKNGSDADKTLISSNAKSSSGIEKHTLVAKKETSNPMLKSPEPEINKNSVLPRMKRPDTETIPLLQIDEIFRKRWHVEGMIGKGGYGEIYSAIDMKRTEEIAIKAEPKTRRGKIAKRMILEQKVLVKMQGKPHVPMVFASGHTEKMNFIIMQLLSINVGEIRKASPTKKLGKSTTGRILIQSIAALRDLHETGYVHRDVKPANMCFGITSKNRHVLMLLDFGLIRRFKNENDEWRRPRERAGFRGTHRYVSTRVHDRLEQSPADDMVSLLYTGYELLMGELPWRNLEKNDEIKKLKESMQNFNSSNNFFSIIELQVLAKAIFSIEPNVLPQYSQLQNLCKPMIGDKTLIDNYDWEDSYKDAVEETSDKDSMK